MFAFDLSFICIQGNLLSMLFIKQKVYHGCNSLIYPVDSLRKVLVIEETGRNVKKSDNR